MRLEPPSSNQANINTELKKMGFNLTQEKKHKRKSNKDWIWWTLFGAFIVGSMGAMFAADYFYAPGSNNPASLPEAVGK